ncbi:hypothetical protein [Consotaella aegiceratis]|uniref:hypothetical protein n=1 Tax=Consotaella aegiceratis TaxID=3097961 RepID=UPI002F3EB3E1
MTLGKETRDNVWTLIAAPGVWALHFVASYGLAASVCAPNAMLFESIAGTRLIIGVLTVAALGIIGFGFGFARALREWRGHGGGTRHDLDTPENRERFLEFSTVLLAGLSLIGVVFNVLPVLLISDCR